MNKYINSNAEPHGSTPILVKHRYVDDTDEMYFNSPVSGSSGGTVSYPPAYHKSFVNILNGLLMVRADDSPISVSSGTSDMSEYSVVDRHCNGRDNSPISTPACRRLVYDTTYDQVYHEQLDTVADQEVSLTNTTYKRSNYRTQHNEIVPSYMLQPLTSCNNMRNTSTLDVNMNGSTCHVLSSSNHSSYCTTVDHTSASPPPPTYNSPVNMDHLMSITEQLLPITGTSRADQFLL